MTNSKKVTDEDEGAESPTRRYRGWDMSRVFWGLVLVLVGLLLLLDNFGVVDVSFGNIWQLWPLLIVLWGVSLLNIKGSWWTIVSAVLLIASLGLIAWAAVGTVPTRDVESRVQSQRIDRGSGEIDKLEVTVKSGAGKLQIGSRDAEEPVEAVLRSGFTSLNVDSQTDDSTQRIEVSASGDRVWWTGGVRNDLDVWLTRRLPVDLNIHTGASDLDADLSDVMLKKLDIDLGASSGLVTLGDLVDLVDVQLSAGASSVTLRVPRDSGVSVQLDKGLSSQDIGDLQDKGDGVYESADFDSASKKIIVRGDIGVTSFRLERY